MHGWHSDSLGERPYDFCFKRLKSKNYLFGKISIALQKNTKIGGNIDIAKATFKNYGQIANRQSTHIKHCDLLTCRQMTTKITLSSFALNIQS